MNIANAICGYSKEAAIVTIIHPHKVVKMDRTTEDVATPVPTRIMEHYKDIHFDIDLFL